MKVNNNMIVSIFDYLNISKDNFDSYFLSELKSYQIIKWISNDFQEHDITNRLSIRNETKY